MPMNFEKYRQYVDHCDMTEAQKIAFLETLWSIMEAFVDDAWPIAAAANDNSVAANEKTPNNLLNLIEYSCLSPANENTPVAAAYERATSGKT